MAAVVDVPPTCRGCNMAPVSVRAHRRSLLGPFLVAGSALVAGCGGTGDEVTAADGDAGCGDEAVGDVALPVRVGEWFVAPSPRAVPAGSVVVSVRNVGTEVHELRVVRVEASTGAGLVRTADGALDEAAMPPGSVVGGVEGVPPGGRCSTTLELPPGQYELVCNLVGTGPDGSTGSHFRAGTVAPITVV
jgi:hypothetical protein